ncbi:MAG: mechanosensitive ion channel, partial [Gammaproteobacteria bacterium]|nr:mechanosensitive ion channel [Gammaproteobacteria bacterium]
IDEKIFKLKEANDYLNDAQSNTLEIVEEGLISNLKSSLLRQKALLAEIQVAREEVQLNNMLAKQSVAYMMLQVPGVSAAELVDKYNKRASLLKDISVQNEVWHSSLMREINLLIETVPDQDDVNNVGKVTSERKNTVRDVAIALRELGRSLGDLSFFSGVERKLLAKKQGILFSIRSNSTYTFGQLWEKTQSIFAKSLFSIGDVPVTAADILRALIIVLIAYFISRIVRKVLTRISTPADGRISPVIYTLSRLSHYLILIIGLMIALTSIGLNFTNLAIVAGALSVGIGFGLQSIVNNFVSGIIILFEQNIKVGDFVQLDSGMNGVVRGIHVRSTVITTLDNLDIIVPNSELVTAKVVNYTMNEPMFRIHVPFGVAYGSDKTIVAKAGLEAAKNVEVTYDDGAKRRPQVWLTGFGDSSLNFELIVWVVNKKGLHATPGSWKALYVWEIETALEKYGIVIPFPQRDLHLKSGFVTT